MPDMMLTADQKRWIEAVLTNDEASSDAELREYFEENGLTAEQAAWAVEQRADAIRGVLAWRLQ